MVGLWGWFVVCAGYHVVQASMRGLASCCSGWPMVSAQPATLALNGSGRCG